MSFEFLHTDAAIGDERFAPLARTPMEDRARAAGARFEVRDGWNLAVAYGDSEAESTAIGQTVGWTDVSHLGKIELQGEPGEVRAIVAAAGGGEELALGHAARVGGIWWCPLTQTRVLVICEPASLPRLREALSEAAAKAQHPTTVLDVTTVFAALTLLGPLSRETFARFSALDIRDKVTPIGGLRPGSIARQPGILIREDTDRFLLLFGWGTAEYIWTVVSDAAVSLGGAPVGLDALPPLAGAPVPEAKGQTTSAPAASAKADATDGEAPEQPHSEPSEAAEVTSDA
jgi:glycine cleavage system aminomethyltransferase T